MIRLRYDVNAEKECEIVLLCQTCRKMWRPSSGGDVLNCPNCHSIRNYAFRCMKCTSVYMPKKFEPRICSKCHPELFVEEMEMFDDDIIFFGASGCSEEDEKINQGRYQYSTKYEDIMVNLGILYDNEEESRKHKVLYVTDTHTNKKYRLFESQSDFSVVQIDNDKGLIHIKEYKTVRVYDIKACKQVRWYRG